MTVSYAVRDAMQHEMEWELKHLGVNIPGVTLSRFTRALADGVCKGLERWEPELVELIRQYMPKK